MTNRKGRVTPMLSGKAIKPPPECITENDIARTMNKTKIGQTVIVHTCKTNETIHDAKKHGAYLRAVVVAKYPRFAEVQLKSGVRDSIMWVDMIIAERAKKRKK